jgi:hypothetical protein
MRCLRALLLVSCVSLTASAAAFGQEEDSPPRTEMQAASDADQWIVRGLTANDLLRIREEPSPLGKTLGRLPNGSLVAKRECETVDGYEWCRVEAADVADLSGWTPARYIQSLDEFSAEMEAALQAPESMPKAELDVAPEAEPPAPAYADVPIPQPAPRADGPSEASGVVDTAENEVTAPADDSRDDTTSAPDEAESAEVADAIGPVAQAATETDTAQALPEGGSVSAIGEERPAASSAPASPVVPGTEARLVEDETASALPPGLEARFAGAAPAPLAEEEVPAEELALAPDPETAEAEQAIVEVARPLPAAEEVAALDANDEADASTADTTPAAQDAGVPLPTPRPGSNARADDGSQSVAAAAEETAEPQPTAAEPEQVALATGATTAAPPAAEPGKVAGDIPCARYLGQPMARCILMVTRTGDAAADLTIVWPDGGTRLIEVRDGVPTGSNSRGEFRLTREGTLSMIRIGPSERFEILDALALDD